MTKRESSLLWSLERGLGIGLQAMQEKKAPQVLRGSLLFLQAGLSLRENWALAWVENAGSRRSS